MITFKKENWDALYVEGFHLIEANGKEVDFFGEPLDVDVQEYYDLCELGILNVYIARNESKIIGYCMFIMYTHNHHKTLKIAHQDVIYIDPKYRTAGIRMIKYTEQELKKEGVDMILHGAPNISRLGAVLERLGYNEIEKLYTKRL